MAQLQSTATVLSVCICIYIYIYIYIIYIKCIATNNYASRVLEHNNTNSKKIYARDTLIPTISVIYILMNTLCMYVCIYIYIYIHIYI